MEVQNLGNNYGVRYSLRKKGPYSKEYEFKYSRNDLGQMSHTVGINPITDFSIREGAVSKKSGATLIWEGPALSKNQELVLFFTDEKKKAFPIQVKGPTSGSELFISAEMLSGLTDGKGQLMLIIKQLDQVDEKNFTKISEIEFYSGNADIEVKS